MFPREKKKKKKKQQTFGTVGREALFYKLLKVGYMESYTLYSRPCIHSEVKFNLMIYLFNEDSQQLEGH